MNSWMRLSSFVMATCCFVLFRETSLRIHIVSSFQIQPSSYVYTRNKDCKKYRSSVLYSGKQPFASAKTLNQSKTRKYITHQSRELLQSFERINKEHSSTNRRNNLFNIKIDELLKNTDLTQHLIPRDSSSVIRLFGRNRMYESMLKFCRRYCHDIVAFSDEFSRRDAEEAVLYCYTAAIGACSKPNFHASNVTGNFRCKTFLLSLLTEMENKYTQKGEVIKPNSYTLSAVLLGIDDGSEAYEVLEQFEQKYSVKDSDNIIVTVQVYNAAIAACGRSSRHDSKGKTRNAEGWQLGLSLYNKMRRHGPAPNEQTYLAVLQALADYGQVRVAMSIYDEIRPSATTELISKLYKPLLKSCATARKANVAETLIKQMKDDSIKITTEHMNLFILTLTRCKMHTRALQVLHEMVDLQESDNSVAPDIITFNTVLSACANSGDYEAAQDLLNDMREGIFLAPVQVDGSQSFIAPDVISYNTVISCADPETALRLINEMRLTRRNRDGIVIPNSISYTNAISRCRKASISSDPETRQYAFDIAFTLFELAKESSLDKTNPEKNLNVYLYSSLIWVAESVGNYKAAVQLLRDMECTPNSICYEGVISALSVRGLHREALYFYYEMQKLGIQGTRNIYLKMAFAINNARDPEVLVSPRKQAALLEGVLSQMSERDRRVSIGGPLFESLIKCHGDKVEAGSSHSAARAVFDQIIGPVDNACLSSMLRVYSSTSMWEEATMLLHCSDIVPEAT